MKGDNSPRTLKFVTIETGTVWTEEFMTSNRRRAGVSYNCKSLCSPYKKAIYDMVMRK